MIKLVTEMGSLKEEAIDGKILVFIYMLVNHKIIVK